LVRFDDTSCSFNEEDISTRFKTILTSQIYFAPANSSKLFEHSSLTLKAQVIMQSKAELHKTDSEDYILVRLERADEMRDDDLSDDDSYDYCDDYNSVHSSSGKTTSICSDSIGSVLTVTSVLLKDLDEAHAAAELAIQDDLDEVKTVESSPSITKSTVEAEHVTEAKKTKKVKAEKKKEEVESASSNMVPLSRTSNKKRRKQLRVMKKAQAAANASKALSEKGPRRPASSTTSPKKNATKAKKSSTNNSRGKRVHPHVACATETLANYREELRMTQQQSV
jgi:hypothetical protein